MLGTVDDFDNQKTIGFLVVLLAEEAFREKSRKGREVNNPWLWHIVCGNLYLPD
jgi:hypothetical protein